MRTNRQLLEQLVACRPVTADVAAVNRAVEVLRAYLADECGLCTRVEEQAGRAILFASTRVGQTPEVLFNTHLDVVPAEEDLFVLRERDGWLYGRGTDDCLGNSAMVANVLARLAGRADVGAVFSTDEEVGGATTAAMVARGYRGRDLVIVVDAAGYSVTTAQKGVLNVTLRATGVAAHAAEPWKGQNAIDRLLDGYVRIRPLFPPVAPPDTWRHTMVASQLRAGTVTNRVPETAEMTLNIRYTEAEDPESLLQALREASGLEVQAHGHCPPVFLREDTPVFARLAEHMRRTLGRDIPLRRMNGATDARHFVDLGTPIAILGGPGKDPHGREEAVDLAGLQAYEDMLVGFIEGRLWA